MTLIKLLGGATVTGRADGSGGLTRRHPLALLALLATAPSLTLSRSKLVGLLWPEVSEATARNRLTSCVYEVRSALGAAALETRGDDLRFHEVVQCDVCRFSDAVAAGDLANAVDWYGGPFLDGFNLGGSPEFEQRTDRERDRLRWSYQSALETLARRAAELGDREAATGWWRMRAAEDPYDSAVALELITALAAAGNRAEALRVADGHVRAMDAEFGAEPEAAFQRAVERLRAASTNVDPATSLEADASSNAVAASIRAVAVLPFRSLSGTEEAEPFAAGLHDDLLTELSRISALTVISRTSVLRYRDTQQPVPEIARELGAGTVVEGTVQVAGGRVRLNVQLIDARTDAHQWAERYDRELSAASMFDLQSELAARIATGVQATLTAEERQHPARRPTDDLEAWRLHAQGRRWLDRRTEDGMRGAAGYFRAAIEIDAGYAPAWLGLADALTLLHDYGHADAEDLLSEAMVAVRRALQLDPRLGEAHATLGLIRSNMQQGPAAIAELMLALDLRPGYAEAHNWLAWVRLLTGRNAGALVAARRAVELDPLSPEAVSNLSISNTVNDLADIGVREARRVREMQPDWTTGPFYEAVALYRLERFAEAAVLLDGLAVPWAGCGALATLALSRIAAGDRAAGAAALEQFGASDDDVFAAALIRLALGDDDRALQEMETVRTWGSWATLCMHHLYPPVTDRVRADARYLRVLRNMAQAWGVDTQEVFHSKGSA